MVATENFILMDLREISLWVFKIEMEELLDTRFRS